MEREMYCCKKKRLEDGVWWLGKEYRVYLAILKLCKIWLNYVIVLAFHKKIDWESNKDNFVSNLWIASIFLK